MVPSWRSGCPVDLSDLRYLTLTYFGFDRRAHQGELVVAAAVAEDVVTVFRKLYAAEFFIRQMRLVDDYDGSDDESMAADNTSGFNCRLNTAGTTWSQHSYGQAIDINPLENPYLSGSTVLPPAGAAFLDRPDYRRSHPFRRHLRARVRLGRLELGRHWSDPRDLQHFSANGR